MKKKRLFFDLDGTLIDSSDGILRSLAYALEKMGKVIPERTILLEFIGPPLKDSFEKYLGFSENEVEVAIDFYHERYKEKGVFENVLYEGIVETLETLQQKGYCLYIATSKPEIFAKKILAHLGLADCFEGIYGASMDRIRCKKADVIAYALASEHLSDTRDCLMIGDREHDLLGAAANDMDSCGVLWGFGDFEELSACAPAFLLRQPLALLEILEAV